jgi:HK97 gp10 family phage protein
MAVDWDLSELNTLAADLGKATAATAAAAAIAVTKTAHDIETTAKALCPVDTGNLRNSISTDIHGLEAEVGPTASYGGYVELGTVKMAPRAYLGPALDRHAPEFVAAIEAAAKL